MKQQALAAFGQAYHELLVAVDVAAPRGYTGQGGWGAREVLGHVAAWEDEATRRIPLLTAGAPGKEYDTDAFNAAAVATLSTQSLDEVRARLERTHARFVVLLERLDETAFAPGGAAHDWVIAQTTHCRGHALDLATAPNTSHRAPM